MSKGELTGLQRAVLHEFFGRERGFFLTGGAALVGYYLHHRATDDLDLFTTDAEAFERGRRALAASADALQAVLKVVQDTPEFKRFSVERGDDLVVVDLVRERVPQLSGKVEMDGVLVDALGEILANKLTTVVSRMEERDLVDLYTLELRGHHIEDHLAAALSKDGGCTPATLAWLLSEMKIPDDAKLPGNVDPKDLQRWISGLVPRLRRAAAPTDLDHG